MVSFNLQLVKMSFSVDHKTFQILLTAKSEKTLPTFRDATTGFLTKPASYPDVSLLMNMCAQRKAGRRQQARRRFACRQYPSHGPLRFITSHSFRARLCQCEKRSAWGRGCRETTSNDCKNSAFFFRLVAAFSPRQVALLSHIPPTVTGVWYDDNETRITGL